MMRPLALILLMALCACAWVALAHLAIYISARVTLHADTVLAAMMLAGGAALIASGLMLRHAGVRLIDHASGFAVADAGRVVTAVGSLVLAAGSGAVMSMAVSVP